MAEAKRLLLAVQESHRLGPTHGPGLRWENEASFRQSLIIACSRWTTQSGCWAWIVARAEDEMRGPRTAWASRHIDKNLSMLTR